MKASAHTGESGKCETRMRNLEGREWREAAAGWEHGVRCVPVRCGCVNCGSRGPVGRAAAYFKPGCALHRPLCETVGYARRAAANSRLLVYRRAGRKSGTRRSGAAARAASTRPADSSEVPPSVVLVSLLERWNYVAQVLRLQRDYFKLDNYRGHDLDPRLGSRPQPPAICTARYISRVKHT
ncbi:unnamed protein product [Arctia plantaginis]|uniref:Uncharacterized protein n=1 Tax=Arctia plantaginis TaxID=874455 RepID=A0A8S1AB35_ARCPL|nr:unnamed protein product [Arctia plantaginis]CAB3248983.1 unnamed protein product [Arctia plantaginis]